MRMAGTFRRNTEPVLEDPLQEIGYDLHRRVETSDLGRHRRRSRNISAFRMSPSVKLMVPATNEFGDPLLVKRLSTGATVKHLDTHHYHPACLDYKL